MMNIENQKLLIEVLRKNKEPMGLDELSSKTGMEGSEVLKIINRTKRDIIDLVIVREKVGAPKYVIGRNA